MMHASSRMLEILQDKGVSALKKSSAEPRHQTVSAVIEQSLTLLEAEDQQRLSEISVFPEDIDIPLSAVATLWGLSQLTRHFASGIWALALWSRHCRGTLNKSMR